MRKFFAVITLAATLLSLLGGCGAKAEPAETTMPAGSGKSRKTVLANFELQIIDSELADYYTTTRLPETELPDTGDIVQTVVVTDTQDGYTYHMRVYATASGDVYRAFMECKDEGLAGLAFPTFCLYVVNALELTTVDGFELSEELNLFGDPSGSVTAEDWELSALSAGGTLTFSASYSPE